MLLLLSVPSHLQACCTVALLHCRTAALSHCCIAALAGDADIPFYTFRLGALGDFGMAEIQGGDDGTLSEEDKSMHEAVNIWFFVVTIIMSITMMNLLIGILSRYCLSL